MNIDAKRHKLLGILSKQANDLDLNKAEYNALGVSFERILYELNCNEDELQLITSDLYTSDEIGYHNAYEIVGLFAKEKGMTAFANKKYRERIYERRKEFIKFLVQTIIPILALIVAILSLSLKFENLKLQSDKELQELKDKLNKQENQLNQLELKTTAPIRIDSSKFKNQ
ncbi:hypothetical protein QRD02_00015 [Aequorivita sp. SDUM287046]|uniref:Uncharacterized protein n=1 Tax=Aequorivita aurantiaca TaxID=3053356 RepID=A0ABT8DFT5_9FLAO|nr:hypothetical protein [Aequorivita aurantiaca]MDN3722749.1 hypothetical protein [Aequorivita aurantiaca]